MLIDGTQRRQNEEENTTLTGGASGNTMTTSVAPQQGQTTPTGAPTRSGSWTNLGQYLDKSRGNVQQTANRIQQNANQTAQQAQGLVNTAKTQGETAQNQLNQLRQDQEFVQGAFNDPTRFVENQENVQRFTNLRNNLNANPTQTVNQFGQTSAQALAEANRAGNALAGVETQGGLTDKLRAIRQTPRYSQGSQALDRFLLTGTDEGQQTIQNVAGQGRQLLENQDLQNMRTQLETGLGQINPNLVSRDQIQNMATTNKQDFMSQLTPNINREQVNQRAIEQFFGGDANRLAQARRSAEQTDMIRNSLASDRSQLQSIDNQLNSLYQQRGNPALGGIGAANIERQIEDLELGRNLISGSIRGNENMIADFESTYGQPLNQFQQFTSDPTAERALRANELARLRALAQLSGGDVNNFLNQRIL